MNVPKMLITYLKSKFFNVYVGEPHGSVSCALEIIPEPTTPIRGSGIDDWFRKGRSLYKHKLGQIKKKY